MTLIYLFNLIFLFILYLPCHVENKLPLHAKKIPSETLSKFFPLLPPPPPVRLIAYDVIRCAHKEVRALGGVRTCIRESYYNGNMTTLIMIYLCKITYNLHGKLFYNYPFKRRIRGVRRMRNRTDFESKILLLGLFNCMN